MQVTDLSGNSVKSVLEGREYKVPCVYGIPIICPSHIDEGNQGPTSKHWHTDDRFGPLDRKNSYWHPDLVTKLPLGDTIRSDTIRDEGQEVKMETLKATKTEIRPNGAVFSSLMWLYKNLGHLSSDGFCVHHRTPLVEQDGCLQCPAHGLKYKLDGTPRYKGPFFLSMYTDIGKVRGEVAYEVELELKFEDRFIDDVIFLEDSLGEVIAKENGGVVPFRTAIITSAAWPKGDGAPRLAPRDPRPD